MSRPVVAAPPTRGIAPRRQPRRVAEQATTWIAVLGTGSIGARHLRGLSRLAGVRPIAVPLRSGRRGELRAEGYAVAADLADAVRMGAQRCVIATDTGRHVQDALAALGHGLDVLVEKPLATTAQEAVRLRDRAQATGRRIFVGCVLRFSGSLSAFRAGLDQIGRVHGVQIVCQSYLPDWRPSRPYRRSYSARANEGGVLRDLIHEIDYAGWLFGWPQAVEARLRNSGRLKIEEEEIAQLNWDTPDGASVSVRLDYLTRPPRRRLSAFGEQGTIEWDGITNTVTLALSASTGAVQTHVAQDTDEMFALQARAFLNAGNGVRDVRLATGEEGVRALAVCDAARRASASRREECVVS